MSIFFPGGKPYFVDGKLINNPACCCGATVPCGDCPTSMTVAGTATITGSTYENGTFGFGVSLPTMGGGFNDGSYRIALYCESDGTWTFLPTATSMPPVSGSWNGKLGCKNGGVSGVFTITLSDGGIMVIVLNS